MADPLQSTPAAHLWRLLVQQGIGEEWPDEDVVARVGLLTQLALEDKGEGKRELALGWHSIIERRNLSAALAVRLDLSWANAIAGGRYGTQWQWDQPTLASEIYHLRRAVSNPAFTQISDRVRCKTLNNLGNRLRVAGRVIEAVDLWRRALEVLPNFGMALGNRARTFAEYGKALRDPDMYALFLWVAHREASTAVAPTALYSNDDDRRRGAYVKDLKQWIESVLQIEKVTAADPLSLPDTSSTEDERAYRQWCIENYLCLNPSNDLGPYSTARVDSLILPTHVVPVESSGLFQSFFDQMKQEYVSARWCLYQGATAKQPHFSDKDVPLYESELRPALCLAVEQVKSAYRTAYSIFDKIGFFVNAYMDLGIQERDVTFRAVWRTQGSQRQIRPEFDRGDNWAFCALYWMALDFSDKSTDEVAEPSARSLSEIRNHLEHKYLRLTKTDASVAPAVDLAHTVARAEFEAKAVHLLKLARAALIYLALGVGFEEARREAAHTGQTIEELPSGSYLSDAEKI